MIQVTHYPKAAFKKPTVLVSAAADLAVKASKPRRQTIEVSIDIRPGDEIDFVVDARHDHDCDGLHIIEGKIWPPKDEQTKKKAQSKVT